MKKVFLVINMLVFGIGMLFANDMKAIELGEEGESTLFFTDDKFGKFNISAVLKHLKFI